MLRRTCDPPWQQFPLDEAIEQETTWDDVVCGRGGNETSLCALPAFAYPSAGVSTSLGFPQP